MAGSDGHGSAKVSVKLGKGDGTFQASQDYAVGSAAFAVATGDFNADGIPDLVVVGFAEGMGTATVLLGNGDGTFQAPRSYAAGRGPFSVVIADFNGDGIPDFAVANAWASTVNILLGNSDGTFQAAQSFPIGSTATCVAAADFNGDGFPDLALAGGGTVKVLLNDAAWRR